MDIYITATARGTQKSSARDTEVCIMCITTIATIADDDSVVDIDVAHRPAPRHNECRLFVVGPWKSSVTML